jgi:hypothetical protein
MDRKPEERIGWIEMFYGDYWAKRKKLIVAGFCLPLIFSFLLLLELNCILSLVYGMDHDLIKLYEIIMGFISQFAIWVFIISIIFFISFSHYLYSYYGVFEKPLRMVHQEIFIKGKPNHYAILVKNFVISCLHSISKMLYLALFLVTFIILLIPSTIVGFTNYLYLDLFFAPQSATFLSLIPVVGEAIKKMILFISESIGTGILATLQSIPLPFQIILLFLPILLSLPISDLVVTTVYKRQRGNVKDILKNGLRFLVSNINFPRKIGTFIHVTFLCLFTDQRTVSLDIPVINSRNIETAIYNTLGLNQKCYVAKLSLDPQKIISDIESFPQPIVEEIKTVYQNIYKKWGLFMTETFMESKYASPSFQKLLASAKNMHVIFGVNENGTMVYAIVEVPPPMYMTRIISRIWCSDPSIKNRIITELNKLDA